MALPFGSPEEASASLGHKGLTPIRSRLWVRSSVPHRGLSFVRSPKLIWGLPQNKGLASSPSNRPGTLLPHLGRAGPFLSAGPFWSSSGTGRPRASSLLASTCSRWQILHHCNFTNHLVESPGWWPKPGCFAWRNLSPKSLHPSISSLARMEKFIMTCRDFFLRNTMYDSNVLLEYTQLTNPILCRLKFLRFGWYYVFVFLPSPPGRFGHTSL